jgi:hypothetical protein
MYLDGGADDCFGDLIESILHRPMEMQDPCDLIEFIGRLHSFCEVDLEVSAISACSAANSRLRLL